MFLPIISERSLTVKVTVKKGLLYVDYELLLEVQRVRIGNIAGIVGLGLSDRSTNTVCFNSNRTSHWPIYSVLDGLFLPQFYF